MCSERSALESGCSLPSCSGVWVLGRKGRSSPWLRPRGFPSCRQHYGSLSETVIWFLPLCMTAPPQAIPVYTDVLTHKGSQTHGNLFFLF